MRKQVLVTGGAQRLGALLCRHFAQAGWDVWCHYQRSGAAAQQLVQNLRNEGAMAHTVQADLAVARVSLPPGQSLQLERDAAGRFRLDVQGA